VVTRTERRDESGKRTAQKYNVFANPVGWQRSKNKQNLKIVEQLQKINIYLKDDKHPV